MCLFTITPHVWSFYLQSRRSGSGRGTSSSESFTTMACILASTGSTEQALRRRLIHTSAANWFSVQLRPSFSYVILASMHARFECSTCYTRDYLWQIKVFQIPSLWFGRSGIWTLRGWRWRELLRKPSGWNEFHIPVWKYSGNKRLEWDKRQCLQASLDFPVLSNLVPQQYELWALDLFPYHVFMNFIFFINHQPQFWL